MNFSKIETKVKQLLIEYSYLEGLDRRWTIVVPQSRC